MFILLVYYVYSGYSKNFLTFKSGGGLASGLVSKVFIFMWLKNKILPKIHRKELKSLPKNGS